MMPKPKKQRRASRQSVHVPAKTLEKLAERDGHRSAWTGHDVPELVPQHRQGGMGGRRGKHALSNLVWLESEINGLIESDPNFQAEAVRRGIKVSGFADPQLVPVVHAVHDGPVYLTDGGEAVPADEELRAELADMGGSSEKSSPLRAFPISNEIRSSGWSGSEARFE